MLYKIPYKTQLDANILFLLLFGRAFRINNPLHIQPSAEFNGKIFRCSVALMAQLNALISLPQQVAGLIWKRSEPFLEKPSCKPIKFYCDVENASDFE